MTIEQARLLSQSLLYEGYILWPYRANALKNNPATRFQFEVLMPQLSDPQFQQEPYSASTHILFNESSTLTLYLRFLQLQSRTVEKKQEGQFVPVDQLQEGKKLLIPWDEAIEHDVFVPERVRANSLRKPRTAEEVRCRIVRAHEESIGGASWNLGTKSQRRGRKSGKGARLTRTSSPSRLSRWWQRRRPRTTWTPSSSSPAPATARKRGGRWKRNLRWTERCKR